MVFVENDFGRYSLGGATDGLKKNPDGSLTIVIQTERSANAATSDSTKEKTEPAITCHSRYDGNCVR